MYMLTHSPKPRSPFPIQSKSLFSFSIKTFACLAMITDTLYLFIFLYMEVALIELQPTEQLPTKTNPVTNTLRD